MVHNPDAKRPRNQRGFTPLPAEFSLRRMASSPINICKLNSQDTSGVKQTLLFFCSVSEHQSSILC